jgi:hypothetical protein
VTYHEHKYHLSIRSVLPGQGSWDLAQYQFLLQQWREIEEMLVEREAVDTGITAVQ